MRLADGVVLRLAGVDAPESGRPGAAAATRLAQRAVASGRPARLQPGRDRYGRALGDLGQGDSSLSRELVAAGLAWVLDPSDPLLAVQRAAVEARVGVHAADPAAAGPYVVSRTRFHASDCLAARASLRHRPWSARAGPLLAQGLAPCRRCLRWPPVGGAE